MSLLAELNSTRGKVSLLDFASNYLDTTDRSSFIEQMDEARLPTAGFDKDIRLVRSHLRRIHIGFESGVVVLAPPKSIGSTVIITELANNKAKVEVTDLLKQMSG